MPELEQRIRRKIAQLLGEEEKCRMTREMLQNILGTDSVPNDDINIKGLKGSKRAIVYLLSDGKEHTLSEIASRLETTRSAIHEALKDAALFERVHRGQYRLRLVGESNNAK